MQRHTESKNRHLRKHWTTGMRSNRTEGEYMFKLNVLSGLFDSHCYNNNNNNNNNNIIIISGVHSVHLTISLQANFSSRIIFTQK